MLNGFYESSYRENVIFEQVDNSLRTCSLAILIVQNIQYSEFTIDNSTYMLYGYSQLCYVYLYSRVQSRTNETEQLGRVNVIMRATGAPHDVRRHSTVP